MKDEVGKGTEQGAAEVEHEELSTPNERLQNAPEEEEPQHVAKDVHDSVGAVEEGIAEGRPGF